jgi:hypothetical protein
MGTRSLTRVIETWKDDDGKEKKQTLITMYRQMDGYPSGHGEELADFLKAGKVVNGLSFGEKQRVFNGAGCLAAQMVSHFKGDRAGHIYLYPNSTKDAWQNYEYHVLVDLDSKDVTLICYESGKRKKKLFQGSPDKFDEFVKEEETSNP